MFRLGSKCNFFSSIPKVIIGRINRGNSDVKNSLLARSPLGSSEAMAEAIESLLLNENARARFSAKARMYSERYSTELVVSLYESFYAKLLSNL